MKARSRAIVILTILFGYVLLQFLWWEVLLVTQNGRIINEKQKLIELTSTDPVKLQEDINFLHHKKKMQTVMIVSEGTVFLLLLLFGLYKIKQAQDKEIALNNQQRNFFLSITHELKTPIAATKLQLQTLQKQKLDESTQKELIKNALTETERLNTLIDNVLFASRLDSGEFVFHRQKQDISAIISEVLSRYYKHELETGEIKQDIEPGLFAEVDEYTFPSVITNLVSNALKYSFGRKDITVQLKKVNAMLCLAVTDSGCGISAADKEKIFTRFFRAGNEETRRSKGTGLGLYIVSYIVKNHDAKIKVKDNTPKGSIFEVQFHAV